MSKKSNVESGRARTKTFAQPRALKEGDSLITGEKIISKPGELRQGSIVLNMRTRLESAYKVNVPFLIPLALKAGGSLNSNNFCRALRLKEGDILATGHRVINNPNIEKDNFVSLHLKNGESEYKFSILSSLPVALLPKN